MEMQQSFVDAVQEIDPMWNDTCVYVCVQHVSFYPAVQNILQTYCGKLRAWPVCLRHAAVLHVQNRFRTWRNVPKSIHANEHLYVYARLSTHCPILGVGAL